VIFEHVSVNDRTLGFTDSVLNHYTTFAGIDVLMFDSRPLTSKSWRSYVSKTSHLLPLLF
jgi:hypothetical protein